MGSMSELKPLLREIKIQREIMCERNSGGRNSAAFGGSGGVRSSSGGRGGTGDKNASSSGKKNKKAGWEDAAVEFYQEAYPLPLDNLYDTHIRTLLPSKRFSVGTLGRSVRRRPTNRSFRRRQSSTNATLVQTTRRGSDTYLEVMPDLTQGVDEEETWEQLQEIRLQAVSMREKKRLKRQLLSVPTLRTKGIAAVHLSRRKLVSQIKCHAREFASKIGVWKGSLRFVEGNFGTGLVAFFTFIKWLLYLNILSSLLIVLFIVIPQVRYSIPEDWCNESGNFTRSLSLFSQTTNNNVLSDIEHSSVQTYEATPVSLNPANITMTTFNFVPTTNFKPVSAKTSASPVVTTPRSSEPINVTSTSFPLNLNSSLGSLEFDYALNDSSEFLALISQDPTEQECCFLQYKKEVETRDSSTHFLLQILLDCLQGTGKLELSQLFYGFYPRVKFSIQELNGWNYSLPLAYISVMIVILFISLIAMVRKAAKGLKDSLRSSEGQFYQTSNLIFGGWDHCIENTKAANIKKKAIFNELKNFLETERYKDEKSQRTGKQRCHLYFVRLFINMIVFMILAASFYTIYQVTRLSLEKLYSPSKGLLNNTNEITTIIGSSKIASQNIWWESLIWEYMPVGTIVLLNIFIPMLFRLLVKFEWYTPNFILTITLFRTVLLRLASLIVLMFTVYQKIRGCSKEYTNECTNQDCLDQLQCWETFFGQQMYKLVLLDLLMMVVNTFLINFPRKLIGDHLLRGSRLGEVIGGIEFGLPKHVLDIVYGQTLCWLGMFYSPLLPIITCVKLFLVFYIKYFDCCINSSQSSQLYRTSRSNSLFISILLLSFVVTIIPVGFSIAELRPSSSCGPFFSLNSIWNEVTFMIQGSAQWIQSIIFFFGTAGFTMPTIIVLILAWYYYYAVAMANKHMVSLLKHQLILEGHDKQFLLTRLEKMVKRSRELEEMARSEASSDFLGTDCGNDDITLDLRDHT